MTLLILLLLLLLGDARSPTKPRNCSTTCCLEWLTESDFITMTSHVQGGSHDVRPPLAAAASAGSR